MYEVKPHVYKETPDKDGPKILTVPEMMELLKKPEFREAVDRYERAFLDGQPSAIKVLGHYQASHDLRATMHAMENKKVIDASMKKQRGELDITREQSEAEQKVQALNLGRAKEPRNPKKPVFSFSNG